MRSIHLDKQAIERFEHKEFNPETCDFIWNDDYSECDVIFLEYVDDYPGESRYFPE